MGGGMDQIKYYNFFQLGYMWKYLHLSVICENLVTLSKLELIDLKK